MRQWLHKRINDKYVHSMYDLITCRFVLTEYLSAEYSPNRCLKNVIYICIHDERSMENSSMRGVWRIKLFISSVISFVICGNHTHTHTHIMVYWFILKILLLLSAIVSTNFKRNSRRKEQFYPPCSSRGLTFVPYPSFLKKQRNDEEES